MRRDRLIKLLSSNEVLVTFDKIDGTRRKMYCTLDERQMPKKFAKKLDTVLETTPGLVTVFDTEAGDWRSFRLNNVIEVETVAA